MSNPTELPDLPEKSAVDRHLPTGIVLYGYTEKAMREYGMACYELARRAQPEGEAPQADMAQLPPGLEFDGYHDSDEHYGKTILDLVRSRLEVDPDELQEGDVFYVSASWVQPQEWRVVRAGNPLEVERISPPAAPAATLSPLCGAQHAESGKAVRIIADEPSAVHRVKDLIAAQQAATPEHETIVREGGKLVCTACGTSAPGTPEAPKKPAHGHRDDYYLLANGRRLGLEPISRVRNMPNWVLAMELFATGSTSAHQICHDAGIDPDSTTIQRAAQLDGGQEGSDHA